MNRLPFNPLPDASELIGCNTSFSARACDGPVRRPPRRWHRPAPTTKNAVCRRGGSPYPPEEPTVARIRHIKPNQGADGDSCGARTTGPSVGEKCRLDPCEPLKTGLVPKGLQRWSLRRLQVKLIRAGRIVRHARNIIFQLAEVAVSRKVFSLILVRINRLRLALV